MKGLIHIYCGDGKGKTTAAIGLAIRAVGRGKQVVMARFLKNDDSGEVGVLLGIPGITLLPCRKSFGFTWNMTDRERQEARVYYGDLLEEAWDLARELPGGERAGKGAEKNGKTDDGKKGEKGADLLVLDEVLGACRAGLVREERLLALLDGKPEGLEVVLTGRGPSKELMARGDYVTRMEAVPHPYEKGIGAREGVEY